MGPKALVPVTGTQPGALPLKRTAAGGTIIDALRGDDQPLYDRRFLTAGLFVEFPFFTENQGAGRSWPSTNVPEARTVPGEYTFSVRAIAFRFGPTVANAGTAVPIADVHLLMTALFVFYKNNNRRFQIRVASLGAGGGLYGVGQGAAVAPEYNNGAPSVLNRYPLNSAIELQAQDNFHCQLEWDSAGNPAAGDGVTFATNLLLEVTLYGIKAGMVDRTG